MENNNSLLRKKYISSTKSVLIKVGTRLLTSVEGVSKSERIDSLIAEIANLREKGFSVVLVTSGAIGAGLNVLNEGKRPSNLSDQQAVAAIGQSRLMYLYETACLKYGFHCAQLLLSADDILSDNKVRHLNVMNCINALLNKNVLPIINENDSVAVDEIKFGDNDRLASLVSLMMRVNLTLILTTVNGLKKKLPGKNVFGDRISVINSISPEHIKMAGKTDGNQLSVGGMATKLESARLLLDAGEVAWILDGREFSVIQDAFNGDDIGTIFADDEKVKLSGHKRWLAFLSECKGELRIDFGAKNAICKKGKSLLPSGIISIKGNFERGTTVNILDEDNCHVAIGLVNYSSKEILKIKGYKSFEIKSILGYFDYVEVIHRNNLVLMNKKG